MHQKGFFLLFQNLLIVELPEEYFASVAFY
jgi:hypothetical protein